MGRNIHQFLLQLKTKKHNLQKKKSNFCFDKLNRNYSASLNPLVRSVLNKRSLVILKFTSKIHLSEHRDCEHVEDLGNHTSKLDNIINALENSNTCHC